MLRTVFLPVLLAAACSTPASKPTDLGTDSADTGGEPLVYPALEPVFCGSAPYAYLPVNDMGEIVAFERDSAFSMTADAIRSLLDAMGYGGAVDIRYDVDLYKVRYITQDRGEKVEVTGFVSLPRVTEPQSFPTALWLHPTMGFGDECAPTAGSLEGAAFPVLWAAQGYVVAAPDYLGMNGWGEPSDRLHSWLVAEPTALASLDAIRAATNLAEELEHPATPDLQRMVAFGASQGGHAALFADHFAQGYAPEMNFLGIVAAVPVTDFEALALYALTHDADATLAFAGGVVTLWDWYGRSADLGELLAPTLVDTLPDALSDACSDFDALAPGIETAAQAYTPAVLEAGAAGDVSQLDPWSCYMNESSLLRNTSVSTRAATPKLLITGGQDTLAWAPPVRADAERLCAEGVVVEYLECSNLGHVSAAIENLVQMVEWGNRRVSGEPLTECVLHAPQTCGD